MWGGRIATYSVYSECFSVVRSILTRMCVFFFFCVFLSPVSKIYKALTVSGPSVHTFYETFTGIAVDSVDSVSYCMLICTYTERNKFSKFFTPIFFSFRAFE